jgi:hypothetical protein
MQTSKTGSSQTLKGAACTDRTSQAEVQLSTKVVNVFIAEFTHFSHIGSGHDASVNYVFTAPVSHEEKRRVLLGDFRQLVAQGKAVQLFQVGGERYLLHVCIKLTARYRDPHYLSSG